MCDETGLGRWKGFCHLFRKCLTLVGKPAFLEADSLSLQTNSRYITKQVSTIRDAAIEEKRIFEEEGP